MHVLAAQQMTAVDVMAILIYLLLLAFLGWLGYTRTKTASDYMLAGRKAHPAIMALSYGATFISTSAIVGFGGTAGQFGMSLLWLTFCNIFIGIFRAFVVMGGPIRRVGPPRNTNAIKIPMKMLQNVSQSRLIPNMPATPPKPTTALVEMNVAP